MSVDIITNLASMPKVLAMSPATSALQMVSLAAAGSTLLFQVLQFTSMVGGSATSIMFELVWGLINVVYPLSVVNVILSPEREQAILADRFWMVYISAALYAALILLNFDLILGEAAKQLRTESSSLVKSLTVANTVVSSLTVLSFTSYSALAADDYLVAA